MGIIPHIVLNNKLSTIYTLYLPHSNLALASIDSVAKASYNEFVIIA